MGLGFRDLGTPVVPFCPFYLGVSNSRNKCTLIINGLLGNLESWPYGIGLGSKGFRVQGLGLRGLGFRSLDL